MAKHRKRKKERKLKEEKEIGTVLPFILAEQYAEKEILPANINLNLRWKMWEEPNKLQSNMGNGWEIVDSYVGKIREDRVYYQAPTYHQLAHYLGEHYGIEVLLEPICYNDGSPLYLASIRWKGEKNSLRWHSISRRTMEEDPAYYSIFKYIVENWEKEFINKEETTVTSLTSPVEENNKEFVIPDGWEIDLEKTTDQKIILRRKLTGENLLEEWEKYEGEEKEKVENYVEAFRKLLILRELVKIKSPERIKGSSFIVIAKEILGEETVNKVLEWKL